jgi:hypothetical protein
MSLIEINVLLVYFVKMFSPSINENIEFIRISGLTSHPLDDRLIKIKLRQ